MIAILIKASLVIIILLAFYKIFLEKESFFAVNRMYLLACLFAAFTLPFLCLPQLIEQQGIVSTLMEKSNPETFSASPNEIFLSKNKSYENSTKAVSKEISTKVDPQKTEATTPSAIENIDATAQSNDLLPIQETTTPVVAPTPSSTKGIEFWILLIYFFGVVILSLNLFGQIVNTLLRVAKNKDKIEDEEGTIINMTNKIEPCSFFKYIFINPASYDYETYEQILAHEKIHVKQMHSIDLLLSELAVIALWFNPFVWKLRTEVEKNIEYQTDDLLLVKEPEEKEEYQLNLVKIATYTKPLTITTNYNQSLIKQRILKMNAKKSNPYGYWKYTFIAPLVFVIVLFLNKPITSFAQNKNLSMNTINKTEQPNITNPSSNDRIESPESINNSNHVITNEESSINNNATEDGKTDCEKLLAAATKDDVQKVRQILKNFDANCLKNVTSKDFDNMDYVKFLADNEGTILIDNYREQIIVEGTVLGLANHDFDIGEGFGNRLNGKCTELWKAIKLEDEERVKELFLKADKSCIVDGDDPRELADFNMTKTIIRSGATIEFHKNKVYLSFDELSGIKTSKKSTIDRSPSSITKSSQTENSSSDCKSLANAVRANDIAKVKALLKKVGPNCIDRKPEFESIEEISDDGDKITYGRLKAKTPLVAAARKGFIDIGELLIQSGANVNFYDKNSDTPLMAAAENGNLEFVKLLLEKGADINTNSQGFGTALNTASKQGHIEVAKYLIAQGANVNIKSNGSGSPLTAAAGNGELEVVKFLLKNDANLDSSTNGQGSALVRAAGNGELEIVKFLLGNGADIDDATNGQGSALSAAAGNGELEVVKYLLSQNASIDKATNGQGSALSAAAGNGELEVVKYLLSQGASIEAATQGQGSALSRAAGNGEMEVVKYLLEQGANIDAATDGQGSALSRAARNGEIGLVKELIAQGADVNAITHGQGSALISATKNNEYEIAKLLLEHKANPWLSLPGQDSPMVIARRMNNNRLIKLFKKYE